MSIEKWGDSSTAIPTSQRSEFLTVGVQEDKEDG